MPTQSHLSYVTIASCVGRVQYTYKFTNFSQLSSVYCFYFCFFFQELISGCSVSTWVIVEIHLQKYIEYMLCGFLHVMPALTHRHFHLSLLLFLHALSTMFYIKLYYVSQYTPALTIQSPFLLNAISLLWVNKSCLNN